MKRNACRRSFAPDLNALEDRFLLSRGATVPEMSMPMPGGQTATEIVFSSTPTYNKMNHLESIKLVAKVESTPTGGMPTGKVTFDMNMPAGMTMSGMKPGLSKIGVATIHHGVATLSVKPAMVVNMPLEILYNGDMNFKPSMDSPKVITEASLMTTAMSTGKMSGMKM